MNRTCFRRLLTASALWAIGNSAVAQNPGFELGFRPMVLAMQGEAARNMVGGGVLAGYQSSFGWYFGGALDVVGFDYERPYRAIGIRHRPEFDTIFASNRFVRVSGWAERRYVLGSAWNWFWAAGLGAAGSVKADVVEGSPDSEDAFNLAIDAGAEVHFMVSIGLRRPLGEHWAMAAALHLERHLIDYAIRDTLSTAVNEIVIRTPVGASATLSYRF